jgi:hypothetical protein
LLSLEYNRKKEEEKKKKKSAIDKGSLPAHCRSSGSSTHDPDDIFWAPTTAGFFQILSQKQVQLNEYETVPYFLQSSQK